LDFFFGLSLFCFSPPEADVLCAEAMDAGMVALLLALVLALVGSLLVTFEELRLEPLESIGLLVTVLLLFSLLVRSCEDLIKQKRVRFNFKARKNSETDWLENRRHLLLCLMVALTFDYRHCLILYDLMVSRLEKQKVKAKK
jgi:hypothetical protein